MENKLRELLGQLQDELEQAEEVGPESRHLLREVMDDIETALERSAAGESPAADESVKGRLDQAVVEFESSHPQLSFTLERLMESLSNMGI